MEFKIEVNGLCAERDLTRLIKIQGKQFGKETITVLTKAEEVNDETYEKKEGAKSETENKKIKGLTTVYALPEDKSELDAYIKKGTEFWLSAVISNFVRSMNRKASPPKGTKGMSNLLYNNQKLLVKLDVTKIKIKDVEKNKQVQIHGIIRSNSAVQEYADRVSFVADVTLKSIIETYGYGEKLLKNALEYLDGTTYIGPFHNSGNGRVTILQ